MFDIHLCLLMGTILNGDLQISKCLNSPFKQSALQSVLKSLVINISQLIFFKTLNISIIV